MKQKTDAYRTWKQTDPAFNEKEAWPKEQFPGASYHYLKYTGCLLTSLAILLRHYGFVQETDEAKFNPWILHEQLVEAGVYDHLADLHLERLHRLYPLEYCGVVRYSREALQRLSASGEPFLIVVPGIIGARHFIAPDRFEGDAFAVFDPARTTRFLEEYENVLELRSFWTPERHTPLGNRTVIRERGAVYA